MKKTRILFLSLLVSIMSFTLGYLSKPDPKIIIKEAPVVIEHFNFQFMTSDTVFCYLNYSHQSNDVEVWGAVRSVICSHNSADLKEPDACRVLSEEILESHDLEVTIHKIRF